MMKLLPRAAPPPKPSREDCFFYHYLDFPDEEPAVGHWDIRGCFDQYIGNYPLKGKTVLDVGTASGFLAFSAEAAGAVVTALDFRDVSDFERVPFAGNLHHVDRETWDRQQRALYYDGLKNGYWYAWHKLNSRSTVSYTPLRELQYYDEMFDIVFAGAIIEHLADPISAIGAMCRKAKEAVIVAFTPVIEDPAPFMSPMNPWNDPEIDYVWWRLSNGLYQRVFANLGFTLELRPARAIWKQGVSREEERYTIIARRATDVEAKPRLMAATDPPRQKFMGKISTLLSRAGRAAQGSSGGTNRTP